MIVLLAGTNNVGSRGDSGGYHQGTSGGRARDAGEGSQRDDRPDRHFPAQRQHGGDADDQCDQCESGEAGGRQKIRYLNVNDKLADADGKLFDGMMTADKLHPAVKGYQVWADALKPIL